MTFEVYLQTYMPNGEAIGEGDTATGQLFVTGPGTVRRCTSVDRPSTSRGMKGSISSARSASLTNLANERANERTHRWLMMGRGGRSYLRPLVHSDPSENTTREK